MSRRVRFYAAAMAATLLAWLAWNWLSEPVRPHSAQAQPGDARNREPVVPASQTQAKAADRARPLPDVDLRAGNGPAALPLTRLEAVARLKQQFPGVEVDFDPVTGSAKWIASNVGLLSGPQAELAAANADAPIRQFIDSHRELFGHGAEALNSARRVTDYTTARSASRKVVWHQQLDGIDVFEAVFQANLTPKSELINLGSQMVADLERAAGDPNRAALIATPPVTAAQAVAAAGQDVGDRVTEASVRAAGPPAAQPDRRQSFRAALLTDAEAKLIWVPMDATTLRLAWDVTITSRARGEMYRVLVDARTAGVVVRQALTAYISDATYRVYTTESPTPFAPGHEKPSSLQPLPVNRVLLTTPALNTTASPNGWIDDGGNQTTGNNTDAYTDTNADNVADTPRTQGSPARVFDFPMSLSGEPSTYKDASVTQLFYWSNFAHDRLYELGFTEAAGNFQVNNFGRGGLGNDLVRSESQDGSGTNNANFSSPVDGSSGRMQMFNWTGPTPDRDGSFEAEVVLHEYCHGLSNRLVGGPSVTISALASRGMGEGWSDFYGLALTSEAGENPHGNWARGGYSRYQTSGWYSENYYFGGRRYSYSTDMLKNPHTFKDIDPGKVDWHVAVPRNPTFAATQDATEVHYTGTVWAVALWDLRANLVMKHGFAIGNERTMFLVTEGMKLGPANPNFLQARDGIVQAALVNHPADLGEVWTAFAKRGMGHGAIAPASSTTTGVTESYAVPDSLEINNRSGWNITGSKGGPFTPASQTVTLSNDGASPLNWTANTNAAWLSASPTGGSLAPGANVVVTVTTQATTMGSGFFSTNVVFSNTGTGFNQPIGVRLYVTPPAAYSYNLSTNPGWTMTGEWAYGTPTGSGGSSSGGVGNRDPTAGATGTQVFGVNLSGNHSTAIAGPHYLTSAPVNLSGYKNTRLRFQRWLNINTLTNSRVTVEISTDGTTWREVFVNPGTAITENAWTLMDYDISSMADQQSAVRARWSYRTLTSTLAYSGWNLDDIEFLGESTAQLGIDFAASVSEGTPALTGTVNLSMVLPSDLVVNLTSSDATAATVPASVTIPAGQLTQNFTITPVNDSALDGTQVTLISAAAAGISPASKNLEVTDNESATLTLTAPATVAEGAATISGSVSVSSPVARDIQVLLNSNNAGLAVPASLTVPAGSAGPVNFTFSAPNNTFAEGTKNVTLTASVPGWTAGTAVVNVTDDESPAILLTGPASVREGDGSQSFTITVNTIQAADLAVDLQSSDATELTVPASVTIPAGQLSANFAVTVVNDALLDGTQTATLTASKSGYANGTRNVTVADNEVSHYTFAAIAPLQRRDQPFGIAVSARDIEGAVITNHAGSVTLTAASPLGPVPSTPSVWSSFSNGTATPSVTVTADATGVVLTATDSGGKTGSSNAFDVERGPALAITPAALSVTVPAEEPPVTRTLNLSNPGTAAVTWSASAVPSAGQTLGPQLATALANLNAGFAGVTALVPNRYDFSDGVTGNSISDGGGDMYDGGNFLGTNITTAGTYLAYSDNVIVSSANLGTGGKYFTRKYPGLFVFAADVAGLSYFEITGDLGADGSGATDTTVLTSQRPSGAWKGFVKRVYNGSDPSVNHLILVEDNGAVTHSASTDTNSDFHRVSGLAGTARIYCLVYASSSGGFVSNAQTQAIMEAFLDAAGTGWLSLSPAAGSLSIGASSAATATLDPRGMPPGAYAASLRFVSNDELAPQQDVPVTFNVAAAVDHFDWAAVPAVQTANVPFAANVSARAADGSLITAFSGAADLTAVSPVAVVTSGAGASSTSYPLAGANTELRMQSIYSPAQVGSAGRIVSLGFDVITLPGILNNFTVRLKHTTKADYSAAGDAVWETTGWTTVYQGTVSIAANGWYTLPLTAPFEYNGTSNLMVDMSFDNAAAVTSGSARATVLSPGRSLVAVASGTAGEPLAWTGATPAAAVSTSLTNLRFSKRTFVTVAPAAVVFADGQWSGNLSVRSGGGSLALRATQAVKPAVAGESNSFSVSSSGALSISAPAGGTEGAVLSATVTVSPAPASALTVELTSSNGGAATVPATVTIPGGQTSAPFSITVVDDALLEGPQSAVITAAAGGHDAGTAAIQVTDNETAVVSITLPAAVSEGAAPVANGGFVNLNAAPAANLTLALQSSDTTELTVPASVVIAAGQTSAPFTLTPVNDALVDADQVVTVTATLAGSPPGTANISVTDDESRALTINLNVTSRTEGSGTTTAAGTVSLSGTAVAPVTVTLNSSDLTELQHSTATIAAGASSGSFDLTAVDDALFDGIQSVTLTASAATFTNGVRTINITDDDVHNFLVSAVASPQVRNAAFNVTFTARDVNNATITGYAGSPVLTANSGGTPLAKTPAAVSGFSSGVKTQSVVVQDYAASAILTLTDPVTGGAGSSNAFVVSYGTFAALSWSAVPSPSPYGTPFAVTVTAQDAQGNVCGNFASSATLQAFASTTETAFGSGSISSGKPLATDSDGSRSQLIHPPGEVGGAKLLTGLALDVATVPGLPLSRFGIRLKHTAATTASGSFDNTALTLVRYRPSQVISTTGWQVFDFDIPFSYNGTQNLLVDLVFDNETAAGAGQCRSTTVSPSRHACGSNMRSWGFGDPYNWVSANVFSVSTMPNIKFLSGSTVTVSPASTGAFNAGVWTGNVTPAAALTGMRLAATSGTISGASNLFDLTGGVPALVAEPLFTSGASNQISWPPASAGPEVEIQRDTSVAFAAPATATSSTAGSHTFSTLTDGVTYYYRARSKFTGAVPVVYSPWSAAISSTQDASAPALNVDIGDLTVANGNASLSGTTADTVSGVDAVTIAGNGVTTADNFAHWTADVSSLANGANSVTVTASDKAVPPNIATVQTTIYRISAPQGDPNQNGVDSLTEHALGIPAGAANPRSMLPAATVQAEGGQKYLTLDYRRRIQRAGLQYLIETSDNLTTWASTGADVTEQFVTPNGDGATETVRVRVTPAVGIGAAKFVRLRVVISPQ